MRSYTQFLNDYQRFTNNTEAANQTFGVTVINDSIRTICNLQGGKLRFLESTHNMSTVATQETYQIPNKFRKLIDMYIYSGSGSSTDTIYAPVMVFDPTIWKRILQTRLGSSDVPYFTYVEKTTYKIQPIPDSNGQLIVLRGRLQTRDLSIADYTTGTIVSVANNGTTVTGSGTSWTAGMAGQYIRIDDSDSANQGDNFWYEISSITDTTHLELVKPYEGTAISAGSSTYTMGQMSVIPEAYDIAVVYRATSMYYQQQGDLQRAKTFAMMYDGGMEFGYSNTYGGIIQQMLDNEGETEEGSYIPPFGTQSNIISSAPYYYSWQLASGFN